MSRLRAGEWIAVAGAAALLVTLFLPWFGLAQIDARRRARGERLGRPRVARHRHRARRDRLRRLAGDRQRHRRPGGPVVAASVLTATAGTFALVALALRALVFQPGPNELVVLRYGAWLGLLAAVVLAVGGWRAIKDERTDARESAYTPPEPRPAPPPRLTREP